jgi:hypothetical protein
MAAQTSQLSWRNRQAASTSVDSAGRGNDMPAMSPTSVNAARIAGVNIW